MKRSDTASPARRRVSDATILMLVALLPAIYAFLALFVFPVQYVSLVTEGALGETVSLAHMAQTVTDVLGHEEAPFSC